MAWWGVSEERKGYWESDCCHEKYRVFVLRGGYYSIAIFQRRKLRHRELAG